MLVLMVHPDGFSRASMDTMTAHDRERTRAEIDVGLRLL